MKARPGGLNPTRRCPHRWCRPLHLTGGTLGLVFLALSIAGDAHVVMAALLITAMTVISVAVDRLVRGRSLAEEFLAEDTGTDGPVRVRAAWARTAVAMDLLFTLVALVALAGVLARPAGDSSIFLPSTVATVLALAAGAGFMALTSIAHRQATRAKAARAGLGRRRRVRRED